MKNFSRRKFLKTKSEHNYNILDGMSDTRYML